MMRTRMVMVYGLLVAVALCGVPQRSLAKDNAEKKEKSAEEQKQAAADAKDKNKDEPIRDGINNAYDEFKKETEKGRKNLNDLYEREKAKSRDERTR